MNKQVKLSVNNLKISFRTDAGKVQAVRDISFDLYKGETLAIVGESGSGKTTIGRALVRINPITSGEVLFKGERISGKITKEPTCSASGEKVYSCKDCDETKKEVLKKTGITLLVCAIMSVIIGIYDLVFSWIIRRLEDIFL